jgi:hypothetical protein
LLEPKPAQEKNPGRQRHILPNMHCLSFWYAGNAILYTGGAYGRKEKRFVLFGGAVIAFPMEQNIAGNLQHWTKRFCMT